MTEVRAQTVAASRQATFRLPIILLAVANLAVLGWRLWPWQNAMDLPGNGTTAIDPAISLAAYVMLGLWIGSVRSEASKKLLFSAAMLGIGAGLLLAGQLWLANYHVAAYASGPDKVQLALFAAAALVLGFPGLRAAREGYSIGFSMVCSIWAALVACLMACTVILALVYFAAGPAESANSWKQYEGLAIGTPAMQAFVQSLDAMTGFLLIGPIVACIAGAMFAWFGRPKA